MQTLFELSTALLLLSLLMAIGGLINPKMVMFWSAAPRRGRSLLLSAGTFVIALILAVASQGSAPKADRGAPVAAAKPEPPKPTPAEDLRKALTRLGDSYSHQVSVDGDGLISVESTVKRSSIWTASSMITTVGDSLRRVGEAASGVVGSGTIKAITLTSFGPGTDRYGNKIEIEIMTLSIGAEDVGKVNWKGISSSQMLGLASVTDITPAGREAVAEWCQDQDYARAAPILCARALTARR